MKKIPALFFVLILLFSVSAAFAGGKAQNTYRIVNRKKLPKLITERKLADDEITGMIGSELGRLKEDISTFGDYIAWVRIALLSRMEFNSQTTSDGIAQFTFGADFSYSWMQSWFSPNMTVSVAQYVLEDDYPGMGTAVIILKQKNNMKMECANYIPADGGFYIMNAELFAGVNEQQYKGSCALDNMLFVSDLTGLLSYYREKRKTEQVVQLLALESADTVVLDPGKYCYVPQDMAGVTVVYLDEDAKYPPEGSRLDFRRFGFPKQINTKSGTDAATARALEKGTYEEAAATIKTLPDVLNYLYYTGYSAFGTTDERAQMHDGEWHFNYKPKAAFQRGNGNCGEISGLIAGLLEGDYDEVGLITLRSIYDGHVINYIKDGDLYYVFDGMSWVVSGFESYGLAFSSGKTLKEAAMKYAKNNDVRQMVAYINPKGGDCPTVFSGNATKLPSHYCDLNILLETPEEGYTYIMIEEDPAVMEAIDIIRSVW